MPPCLCLLLMHKLYIKNIGEIGLLPFSLYFMDYLLIVFIAKVVRHQYLGSQTTDALVESNTRIFSGDNVIWDNFVMETIFIANSYI